MENSPNFQRHTFKNELASPQCKLADADETFGLEDFNHATQVRIAGQEQFCLF